MPKGIRQILTERDDDGSYKEVRIVFGPHYFLELHDEGENLTFVLGATHHGFKAEASEVGGELEKLIYEIRESHPSNVVD
jgi:hypothetical protein